MPSRIMVVHDDAAFAHALAERFGSEITWFLDPMEALSALRSSKETTVLITRVQFADLQSIGLSLARVAREVRPQMGIILTGAPEYSGHVLGMGTFLPEPVDPEQIDIITEWLSRPHSG